MSYPLLISLTIVNLIVVALSGGPVYRLLLVFSPDLLMITLWLYSWLLDRRHARIGALILGLILDLVSYHLFGLTTLVILIINELIILLRYRFFEASSGLQAIVSLLLVASLHHLFLLVQFGGFFDPMRFGLGIFATCLIGYLLYYFLTKRTALFLRWVGKRL